jgi:hypothetical protein
MEQFIALSRIRMGQLSIYFMTSLVARPFVYFVTVSSIHVIPQQFGAVGGHAWRV